MHIGNAYSTIEEYFGIDKEEYRKLLEEAKRNGNIQKDIKLEYTTSE